MRIQGICGETIDRFRRNRDDLAALQEFGGALNGGGELGGSFDLYGRGEHEAKGKGGNR